MSRRRYVSTDAGRDKALMQAAASDPLAVGFYLLAIPAAGDDATLPASDPDELLWEVWPALARQVDAERVAAWVDLLCDLDLWERLADGRLRFPPASFYKYQTYIKDDRRCPAGRGIHPERPEHQEHAPAAHNSAAPGTAPIRAPSIDKQRTTAQISAEERTSAHNSAEQRFASSSDSFRSSSTPDGVAPAADAPAAPAPVAALSEDAEPEPSVRAVPKPKRERAPGHAAVRLYRRATDINPKEGVRQQIEAAVDAEDEDALARWQHVLQEWLSRGYSSKNVIGLLEWFAEGIPPRKRPANVGPAGGSSERGYVPNPGPPPVEWDDAKAAASAAARERTRQELVGSGVLTGRRAPPTVPGVAGMNGATKPPPDAATTERRLAERERRLLAEGVLTEDQIATARRARQPGQVTAGA